MAQAQQQTPLSDEMMAADIMGSAKMDAMMFTTAILESSSQDLRSFFQQSLNHCLEAQGEISKIAEKKGWYQANLEPTEQLKHDLKFVSTLHQHV